MPRTSAILGVKTTRLGTRAALVAGLLCWSAGGTARAEARLAVVASEPPSSCGGASLELERELVAAGFDAIRVPRAEADALAGFDVTLWFSDAGDQVRLLDPSAPPEQAELAVLRVDCRQRLVRRRVWTLIVEMLWARTEHAPGAAAPRAPSAPPPRLSPVELRPSPPPVAVSLRPATAHSYYFGAGGVVGANAFATAPAWDVALLGGYRSPSGYRLGGRLRWPVTVAEEETQRGPTRMWTFTGDVEAGKVFRRPTSVVQPYVGITLGLHFTLLDTTGVDPWLDRRWAAMHGRALSHLGLGFVLSNYTLFCQFEAGVARRLQAEEDVRDLDRGGNAFVAAVALGVSFGY